MQWACFAVKGHWAVLAKNTPVCNIICSLTESTISAQFGLMDIPKCPIF